MELYILNRAHSSFNLRYCIDLHILTLVLLGTDVYSYRPQQPICFGHVQDWRSFGSISLNRLVTCMVFQFNQNIIGTRPESIVFKEGMYKAMQSLLVNHPVSDV